MSVPAMSDTFTPDSKIIQLLERISASLATIEQQNHRVLLHPVINQSAESTDSVPTVQSALLRVVSDNEHNKGRGKQVSIAEQPENNSEATAPRKPVLVDSYRKLSLDNDIQERLSTRHGNVLQRTDVVECLTRLPPDDHRFPITATRGEFLRQFMLKSVSTGSDIDSDRDTELFLKELRRFEDFQKKQTELRAGHIWIRDYDQHGSYVQWDCVNPPVTRSADDHEQNGQFRISGSRWLSSSPIEGELGVKAPWQRIMYD